MHRAELSVDEDTNHGLSIGRRWADSATLLVEFSGHLDSAAMAKFAMCAADICGTSARSIHIELGGLTSADGAGMRVLATFCRILQVRGYPLVLLGPRALVQNVIYRLGIPGEDEEECAAPDSGHGPARRGSALSPGQQQALRLMERELAAQEPGLTAMFASFGRLTGH